MLSMESETPMTTHVLKGSKQEIAERLSQLSGDVREAIVFVDEPATSGANAGQQPADDIFAEMAPLMVDVPALDDSREAVYSRSHGE